jgi:hypothetical protein
MLAHSPAKGLICRVFFADGPASSPAKVASTFVNASHETASVWSLFGPGAPVVPVAARASPASPGRKLEVPQSMIVARFDPRPWDVAVRQPVGTRVRWRRFDASPDFPELMNGLVRWPIAPLPRMTRIELPDGSITVDGFAEIQRLAETPD